MAARLIAPGDAAVLAGLHARCFDRPWDAAQIAGTCALPTTRGWMDEENGVMRGFLLCQSVGGDAEILTLCTDPVLRRQGIARGLISIGIAALQNEGAARLWLDVAADNVAALALYESYGFAANGRRRNYYAGSVDAVLLERALSA